MILLVKPAQLQETISVPHANLSIPAAQSYQSTQENAHVMMATSCLLPLESASHATMVVRPAQDLNQLTVQAASQLLCLVLLLRLVLAKLEATWILLEFATYVTDIVKLVLVLSVTSFLARPALILHISTIE